MKLVKLLSVFVFSLVITSVTVSNHSLDDSQKVSDLTSEIAALEKNVTVIRSELAEAGSITKVSLRAEELGFVATPHVVTLPAVGNVALR